MVNLPSQHVPLEQLEAAIESVFQTHPELGIEPHYVVSHQLPAGVWCIAFYDVKVAPYAPRDIGAAEGTLFNWWLVWSDLKAPYHSNRLMTSDTVNPNCLALRHVLDAFLDSSSGELQVVHVRRKEDQHE